MTRAMAVKVLAGLVALQLLMSGVALATFEDDPQEAELSTGDTSTTSSPAAGVVTETPGGSPIDPGAPPAAGAEGGSATPPAAGGPAGGTDPNALPDRPGPPRAGTYRYRNDGSGQIGFGTFTSEYDTNEDSEVTYETLPPADGQPRDRERRSGSGSSEGLNFTATGTQERSWRNDGMYLTSDKAEGSGGEDGGSGRQGISMDCDWNPDIRRLAFPLRVGQEWKWDSSCESRDEDGEYRRRSQGTGKVVGTGVASVGGREVRVFTIEVKSVEEAFAKGRRDGQDYEINTRIEMDEKSSYASSVALPVRIEYKAKGTFESPQTPGQQGRFEGEGTSELISLDPK